MCGWAGCEGVQSLDEPRPYDFATLIATDVVDQVDVARKGEWG